MKKGVTNMKRCVAYIDLLGFTSYVLKDHVNNDDAAGHMLMGMVSHLLQSYLDTILHPVDSYDDELAPVAEKNSVDDFEAFIQLSDSVFIIGYTPWKTLPQIASFLCKCFMTTSYKYGDGGDPELLTRADKVVVHCDGTTSRDTTYLHPILARGGVTYGDVCYMPSSYLLRDSYKQCIYGANPVRLNSSGPVYDFVNFDGKSVLEAASFDKEEVYSGTGPRLYIHESMYKQLLAQVAEGGPSSQGAKEVLKFIRIERSSDKKAGKVALRYLLWPAFAIGGIHRFIAGDCINFENDFLRPAVNLWVAYKSKNNPRTTGQYYEFVRMCFASLLAFGKAKDNGDGQENLKMARDHLELYIDSCGKDDCCKTELRKLLDEPIDLGIDHLPQ